MIAAKLITPARTVRALQSLADAFVGMQEAQTALGRLGRADEIAAAAAFMCSDDASYVTCETLVAAGGMPSKL